MDRRGMLADLGQHHIGEDIAAAVLKAFDNRRGSLIARRFNAEDDHQCLFCPRARPAQGDGRQNNSLASSERGADPGSA